MVYGSSVNNSCSPDLMFLYYADDFLVNGPKSLCLTIRSLDEEIDRTRRRELVGYRSYS